MSLTKTRLDPSHVDPDVLDRLADAVSEEKRPCLVAHDGTHIPLPDPIFFLLVDTVRCMQEGKTIAIFPESETCTTQAAADLLGVSRQYLVRLLEEDKIPYHRAGTHRRVYFKDILEYQKARDTERRGSLNALFKQVDAAGVYDAEIPPENEE